MGYIRIRHEFGKVYPITSGSNEAAETTGGRGVSRSLVHSNPSFSFNTRRSSWMERLQAVSRGILVMGVIINAWRGVRSSRSDICLPHC